MTYFKNTFLLLAFSMMLASCGSESATQTETASEPETTAAPEQSGILEPVKWLSLIHISEPTRPY